jgi:hypothetical protein
MLDAPQGPVGDLAYALERQSKAGAMSKKGRRNRSKNTAKRATPSVSTAVAGRVLPPVEPAPIELDASTASPMTTLPAESPAECGSECESEPSPESGRDDVTVPPVGDLDARFFDEVSSEDWLAHELDLRDPRFVRKMTDHVVQRRARFARYVAGVVGVAAALCVAALVKSAVPASADSEWSTRPAARMAMPPSPAPAAQPEPDPVELAPKVEPVELAPKVEPAPAMAADLLDGGRG